jgi:hypothetical protein
MEQLVFEGSWEEVASHASELAGKRVRVTVLGNTAAMKAVWETDAALMRYVPDDELETLPADGSIQVDHYNYGTPKRPR